MLDLVPLTRLRLQFAHELRLVTGRRRLRDWDRRRSRCVGAEAFGHIFARPRLGRALRRSLQVAGPGKLVLPLAHIANEFGKALGALVQRRGLLRHVTLLAWTTTGSRRRG